jgi:nitric oxide dioxygenase
MEKLNEAVAIISHKHVSFNIPAEYYEDIGMDLIQAIKDVLGKDATEPIVKAWEEGYDFLANVFIDMEYKMRKDNMKKIGGWFGYKSFKVVRKVPESDQITSFYLKPVDGSALPPFKSGQYLSFNFPRGLIPDVDYDTVRNYSVSCGESNDFFRISAKRELGSTNTHGLVSNYLHDHVQVDSELQVLF